MKRQNLRNHLIYIRVRRNQAIGSLRAPFVIVLLGTFLTSPGTLHAVSNPSPAGVSVIGSRVYGPSRLPLRNQAAEYEILAGRAKAIDTEKRMLTLMVEGRSYPVLVPDSADIFQGTTRLWLEELNQDDWLTIRCTSVSEGTRMAVDIERDPARSPTAISSY